ncbi:hypothetical protein T459_26571 [Capsicum annuum]|uniref:L-2-hydroxyglutarate dehydrogenase, mitochondrial n=1 Tax=Capsicum annuum TaxID=4072 RepID=A0A2G2YNZ1_CAPAN|nr:hypothetical protein T459_26571 [Capsicum annuum]
MHDLTELENLRHNLSEIDFEMRDVLSKARARELFRLISTRASYLGRETKLQKVLETQYNFFCCIPRCAFGYKLNFDIAYWLSFIGNSISKDEVELRSNCKEAPRMSFNFQILSQASFCVRGKELLYKYCKDREIPHKQIGKLIVATGLSEVPKLSALMNRGIQNGVEGLRMMEGYEATTLEPELHCVKALWSPSSGIVDSHSLMLSLVGEAESHGTTFSYNTAVIGGRIEGNQIQIHVSGSDALANWNERTELDSELILIPKLVVNSAGLSAPAIAKRIKGLPDSIIPASKYARGCYFTLSNTKSPFKHLIYPIPEVSGLGVHVTLDLNGQIKFGPDVEWIKGIDDIPSFLNMFDYSVCEDRANQFYPAIRKYYPGLKDGSLEPGYAGIRPKLSGPEEGPTDFVVQGEEVHGIAGLVNLFGIESPGLTSSMAIAEHVAAKLLK